MVMLVFFAMVRISSPALSDHPLSARSPKEEISNRLLTLSADDSCDGADAPHDSVYFVAKCHEASQCSAHTPAREEERAGEAHVQQGQLC